MITAFIKFMKMLMKLRILGKLMVDEDKTL